MTRYSHVVVVLLCSLHIIAGYYIDAEPLDSSLPSPLTDEEYQKAARCLITRGDEEEDLPLTDDHQTDENIGHMRRENDGNGLPDIKPEMEEKPVPTPGGSRIESEREEVRELLQELLGEDTDSALDLGTRAVSQGYAVNLDDLASTHPAKVLRSGQATYTHTCDNVRAVPNNLRSKDAMFSIGIPTFYQKYTEAYGIPIIGSNKATDEALRRACYELAFILGCRYDVRNAYYKLYGKVAVIADGEEQTSLPEYNGWDSNYWDNRARGLGPTFSLPTASVGGDNMRCGKGDRYWDQDILTHEFGHGVQTMGAFFTIKGFAKRSYKAYSNAMAKNLWKGQYAGRNYLEYFATAMQFFFNATTGFKVIVDGFTNPIKNRESLKKHDPLAYSLVEEVYPGDNTQFIERCKYDGRKTPYITQFCAEHVAGANNLPSCTNVKVADRKTCGPANTVKWKCVKTGCCWRNSKCFYPLNDCLDRDFGCAPMAAEGGCTKNPVFMTVNCPFSCDTCEEKEKVLAKFTSAQLDAMCQDTHQNCGLWNGAGYCTHASYGAQVKRQCEVTCGVCKVPNNPFGL